MNIISKYVLSDIFNSHVNDFKCINRKRKITYFWNNLSAILAQTPLSFHHSLSSSCSMVAVSSVSAMSELPASWPEERTVVMNSIQGFSLPDSARNGRSLMLLPMQKILAMRVMNLSWFGVPLLVM